MDEGVLRGKREDVSGRLRELGRVVVAVSGGVDSAVLLALAVEALGREPVLAVTAVSASLSERDAKDARKLARGLGVRHLELRTGELDDPAYRRNGPDRCYHCRRTMFRSLKEIAEKQGFGHTVYGAIADDVGDFRPGMEAARQEGVEAPMADAGITKEEVRALARECGLDPWDKPAGGCLSTRIPFGTEITADRLRQVEAAEEALARLGFGVVRVRHHGEVARVELDDDGLDRVLDRSVRARVVAAARSAGFRFVALDLEGYRRGSLNPPSAVRKP